MDSSGCNSGVEFYISFQDSDVLNDWAGTVQVSAINGWPIQYIRIATFVNMVQMASLWNGNVCRGWYMCVGEWHVHFVLHNVWSYDESHGINQQHILPYYHCHQSWVFKCSYLLLGYGLEIYKDQYVNNDSLCLASSIVECLWLLNRVIYERRPNAASLELHVPYVSFNTLLKISTSTGWFGTKTKGTLVGCECDGGIDPTFVFHTRITNHYFISLRNQQGFRGDEEGVNGREGECV